MFTLDHVHKRFGELVAIEEIDLEVPPGRTLALIGASGSGKSTLLRLMLGLEHADGGEVRFDDRPIDATNIEGIRREVGYVIQEGGLFPHLSARDNVGLLARYLAWTPERRNTRIRELCDLTHLPESALERRPSELSGGQRQRVALMRALMLNPKVVILDEPLGALDPLIRYELQNELRHIFDTLDKTVVLVTHDLGEADFLADELVLLDHGRIAQRGRLEDLRAAPASDFVRRFLLAQRQLGEGRNT